MLSLYPKHITSLRSYNECRSAIIEKTDELLKSVKPIETVGHLKFMKEGFKERLMNVRNAFNQMRPLTASYFEGKTRAEKEAQDIHLHRKIKLLENHFKEIILPITNKTHTDEKEEVYVECCLKPCNTIEKDCEKIHAKLDNIVTNIAETLSTIDYKDRQNKIIKSRKKLLENIHKIDVFCKEISDDFSSLGCYFDRIEESEIYNWMPKIVRIQRKIKKLHKDFLLGKISVIGLLGNLLSEPADIEKMKQHTISTLKGALSNAPIWLRKEFSDISNKLSDSKPQQNQQSLIEPMRDYVKQSWKIHKAIYKEMIADCNTKQCCPKGEKMYEQLSDLDEDCLTVINKNPILDYYRCSTREWLEYVKDDINDIEIKVNTPTDHKSQIKKNSSDSEG